MEFNNMMNIMQFAFIGLFGFAIFFFIFILTTMLNPKKQGKMLSKQIKAMKHMVDYTKDDLEEMITDLGGISVNAQNNIINENEDNLRNIVNKTADIHKDAITTTVKAVKDGLTDTSSDIQFCSNCGKTIDKNSNFCKYCGHKLI